MSDLHQYTEFKDVNTFMDELKKFGINDRRLGEI